MTEVGFVAWEILPTVSGEELKGPYSEEEIQRMEKETTAKFEALGIPLGSDGVYKQGFARYNRWGMCLGIYNKKALGRLSLSYTGNGQAKEARKDGGAMRNLANEFEKWASKNPGVVELFFKFADQAWESGQRPIGAKLIVERIRWETSVGSLKLDFKINNNYTAYLARRYVDTKPARSELFRSRKVRS